MASFYSRLILGEAVISAWLVLCASALNLGTKRLIIS